MNRTKSEFSMRSDHRVKVDFQLHTRFTFEFPDLKHAINE